MSIREAYLKAKELDLKFRREGLNWISPNEVSQFSNYFLLLWDSVQNDWEVGE